VYKARIRLEIGIEIGLDFDQSKQNLLNLRLVLWRLDVQRNFLFL